MAVYAVDVEDFWNKVKNLELGMLWENMGKMMKESGELPLNLANFDHSNPVWVQRFKKAVMELEPEVTYTVPMEGSLLLGLELLASHIYMGFSYYSSACAHACSEIADRVDPRPRADHAGSYIVI
eukprot:SAG11_NODE_13898_length_634_cov_1.029907_1_plen_125_part_00